VATRRLFFEAVDEAPDAVSQSVKGAVNRVLHAAVLLVGISGVAPRARTSSRIASLS
jgi:hypothetical protein